MKVSNDISIAIVNSVFSIGAISREVQYVVFLCSSSAISSELCFL